MTTYLLAVAYVLVGVLVAAGFIRTFDPPHPDPEGFFILFVVLFWPIFLALLALLGALAALVATVQHLADWGRR